MRVFHIVEPDVWANQHCELYRPPGLETEGFIHCSFREQLGRVIDRYYPDAARLTILEIDVDRLMSRMVTEPSTGGEVFPHIYGPINCDAIVAVEEWTPAAGEGTGR